MITSFNTDLHELKQQIGKLIWDRRASLKIPLPALAKKAKVSKSTLWKIEEGISDVQITTLVKVCEALGTSPHNLLENAYLSSKTRPRK